jgi:hypothetical protein
MSSYLLAGRGHVTIVSSADGTTAIATEPPAQKRDVGALQ